MERADEELRRLARELSERRESAYAEVQAEVETMKASLRERAAAIAERERELAELEQRMNENGLAAELANARRLAAEAESERRLAAAERDRLEEREQQIRTVERELAARRLELSRRSGPKKPPVSTREHELDEREAALDARETALEKRERALAGGEVGADTMELSFSDGLAALSQPD